MKNYELISKKQLPAAFVDLDAFDNNAASMALSVKDTKFHIRIATKSIRCPELIRRALDSSPTYKGLMTYSAQETLELAKMGFDDFLLAYPTLQQADILALSEVVGMNKKLYVIVDNNMHLQAFNIPSLQNKSNFHYLVEMDMSLHIAGIVVGVRRSPLRSVKDILDFCRSAKSNYPQLQFGGLMGYEAQVAGLPDRNPFKKLLNPALELVRKISVKKIIAKRAAVKKALEAEGFQLQVFNGGGTGSLSFNTQEKTTLTEVTAGSGFYCSQLFDYYSNFHLKTACYFALPSVRVPETGWLTCLGGGYVASGEPGWDRVPKPLIGSEQLSPFEACGEVQTPVKTTKQLGDPILFRHAKAGELLERFNEVHLIKNDEILNSPKTYRGLGWCFL